MEESCADKQMIMKLTDIIVSKGTDLFIWVFEGQQNDYATVYLKEERGKQGTSSLRTVQVEL